MLSPPIRTGAPAQAMNSLLIGGLCPEAIYIAFYLPNNQLTEKTLFSLLSVDNLKELLNLLRLNILQLLN